LKPALNGGSKQPGNSHPHTAVCECPTCGSVISAAVYAAILGRQRAHDADIERAAEARFAARESVIRKEAATAANAALAPKLAEAAAAKKAAEQAVKTATAAFEATLKQRLATEREAAARLTAEALSAERAKQFGEKLRLEEQLEDMKRRLQAKTAHALGEPSEIDLFDSIVAAFPDGGMRVSRVQKGVNGPDVVCEVIGEHNDIVIGTIILDSKNHKSWQNKFTTKLRADQLNHTGGPADFAILSTVAFPKEARSSRLHLQDGVLVCDPSLVVVLVHLLRQQIVQNHTLKLSAAGRTKKADRLYSFILSPAYSDMLDRLVKRVADLESSQADEIKAHHFAWTKRTAHTDVIRAVIGEFSAAITAIIAGEPA
jgi:hypothetical protein